MAWGAAALVVVLYLPSALLTDAYPVPSPFSSCDGGCPANAFLIGSEPAFVDSVLLPMRDLVTVLVFVAVTARLVQRVTRATPLMKLTLRPVLAVAGVQLALVALGVVARRVSPGSPVVDALVWAIALAVPALALAFLVGLFQRRLYVGAALQGLARRPAAD